MQRNLLLITQTDSYIVTFTSPAAENVATLTKPGRNGKDVHRPHEGGVPGREGGPGPRGGRTPEEARNELTFCSLALALVLVLVLMVVLVILFSENRPSVA